MTKSVRRPSVNPVVTPPGPEAIQSLWIRLIEHFARLMAPLTQTISTPATGFFLPTLWAIRSEVDHIDAARVLVDPFSGAADEITRARLMLENVIAVAQFAHAVAPPTN